MARLNESRIGALLTEPFGAAFTKRAASSVHAEHGTALLVGLDADVTVTTPSATLRGRAVLVPSDTPYAASCPGPTLTYSFDPELSGTPSTSHVVEAVHAHRATLAKADTLSGIGHELLGGTPRPIDRRIARLVETLRDPDADRASAIATTKLSSAHLQALFARDIGIPMRTYSLWRRLLHALAHVGPLDLTAAAHAAGFADLAHFSRTCRRMLGVAPSELRANLVDG
ncbi:MAG: helix-turn-helix domain-containing protein [Myxococcota bacterium]|nr:AraC family transcriptional regulator [Deltaproteobacteria bacterium]MDQ3339030.1 helix-turn-helix domain-containing protein [Myxococcota bacterium]